MKYVKYLIFGVIAMIPLNVKAATYFSLDCKNATSGSDFTCTLVGVPVVDATMDLTLPDGFTYLGNNPFEGYKSVGSGEKLHFKGSTDNKTISVLHIRAPKVSETTKYTIGLSNIKYTITQSEASDSDYTRDISVIGNSTTTTTKTTTTTAQGTTTTKVPLTTTTTTTTKAVDTEKAYLKSISIEGQKIDFNAETFDYNLKVLYEVTSLNILADGKGTDKVSFDPSDKPSLDVGINTIKIMVTNGTANNTYTIKVERLAKGVLLDSKSSDAFLASVSFGKYTVAFNPNETQYQLVVDYGTKNVSVSAITNDPKAKTSIANNKGVTNGTVITVTVTAEDGNTKTYNFKVKINSFFEQYQKYILIIGGVAFCLIVYFVLAPKMKPKKKKEIKVVKKKPITKAKKKETVKEEPKVEVFKL